MALKSAERIMMRVAMLASTLLLVACGSPMAPDQADVYLDVAADVYAPGDLLTAELKNQSDDSVEYSFCFVSLYRYSDGWPVLVTPSVTGATACPMILTGIGPGASVSLRIHLPEELSDGRYSLGVSVDGAKFYADRFSIAR
jgi:hypothetical protein